MLPRPWPSCEKITARPREKTKICPRQARQVPLLGDNMNMGKTGRDAVRDDTRRRCHGQAARKSQPGHGKNMSTTGEARARQPSTPHAHVPICTALGRFIGTLVPGILRMPTDPTPGDVVLPAHGLRQANATLDQHRVALGSPELQRCVCSIPTVKDKLYLAAARNASKNIL